MMGVVVRGRHKEGFGIHIIGFRLCSFPWIEPQPCYMSMLSVLSVVQSGRLRESVGMARQYTHIVLIPRGIIDHCYERATTGMSTSQCYSVFCLFFRFSKFKFVVRVMDRAV